MINFLFFCWEIIPHGSSEIMRQCRSTWLGAFISTLNGDSWNDFKGVCSADVQTILPFTFVIHFELVYLVTALVPSDTACFASSPGNKRRTAVCTSRLVIVERLLYWVSRDASVAILSKTSLTKEFMMLIALLEMPVSGWTCSKSRQQMKTICWIYLGYCYSTIIL